MSLRRRYFVKRMLIIFATVALPVLLCAFLIYAISQSSNKKVVDEKAQVLLTISRNNMEIILDVTGQIETLMSGNSDLYLATRALFTGDRLDYTSVQTYKFMRHIVRYPTVLNPHIHSMYLYLQNRNDRFLDSFGKLVYLDRYPDIGWYPSYLANRDAKSIWMETRTLIGSGGEPRQVLSVYRTVMSGVVVANIDQEAFSSVLARHQNHEGERFLITTDEHDILFSVGEGSLSPQDLASLQHTNAEILLGGVSYIANSQYSERFGIWFWSLVPKRVLYSGSQALFLSTGVVLIVSLLFAFCSAYVVTKRNFTQIIQMIDIFEQAERGRPVESPLTRWNDEYSLLHDNVIRAFLNQSYLKLQLSERKYKLKATELAALQLQINPHFLFNTLQTIDLEIARDHGDTQAGNILQKLSELLHYCLVDPGGLASLGEELRHLQKYCEIQKYRYGSKFFLFLDRAEDVDDIPICKLILQPLVENSLYHGIKPKNGTSFIRVRIRRLGDFLDVRVTDNGVGMRRDILLALRASLEQDSDGQSGHIGLSNTNRRLRLSFGEDSRLRIGSWHGYGTVVSFRVPVSGQALGPDRETVE